MKISFIDFIISYGLILLKPLPCFEQHTQFWKIIIQFWLHILHYGFQNPVTGAIFNEIESSTL